MDKAKVYLFTSPTCPNCPPAKTMLKSFKREDAECMELSTVTEEGQKLAQQFDIRSVPTYIIRGPGFPQVIGLRGIQSEKVLNKYIDVALGKKEAQEKRERKFKFGKFSFKF